MKIEIHSVNINPGFLWSWIYPEKSRNRSFAIRAWADGPDYHNYIVTTSLEELDKFVHNAIKADNGPGATKS